MDLRLLRTFITAAQSPTFSAAAARLRITQPALTKQIQALERRAGTPLFVRDRQGAHLTDPGRALLDEAIDLDRRASAFDCRLRRLAAGVEGHLSLGFGLSSIELAPRLVAKFRRHHPDVTVVLDDLPSSVQLERLRDGSLNGAFVRLPVPADLKAIRLAADHLALACPAGLSTPPSATPGLKAWLEEHPVIRLRPARGPGLATQIEALYDDLGIWPSVVQEADDLQTVLALVAADLGVAVVPASAARVAPAEVQVVPIESELTSWEVALAWNPAAVSGPLRNFLDLVT